MENYPAPSAAQLFTMLLHREHFCSYLYYTQIQEKINKNQLLPHWNGQRHVHGKQEDDYDGYTEVATQTDCDLF